MNQTVEETTKKTYARQYAIACAGIAQHYAAAGDSWSALHAQVLSYTATAELVLRLYSIEPTETLLKVADGIETLDLSTSDNKAQPILSAVLSIFARELPAECVADFFSIIMSPHDLRLNTPIDVLLHEKVIERWLDGNTPEDFLLARRETQLNNLKQARDHIIAGETEDAILAIHNADVAAYETWIVEHALATGDKGFVRARMQWDFFVESLANLSSLPADMVESIHLVRSRMAWALGPDNARNFADSIPEL